MQNNSRKNNQDKAEGLPRSISNGVTEKIPDHEEKIQNFWLEHRIFEKSVEKEATEGNFSFYDGPPFATGLPHSGHLLQSTIKDAIPRYETMRGKRVRRVWGWDCHGLPIENLIEAELGLKHKKEIEEYGVGRFNEKARENVLRYDKEWKKIIPRLGRFIDMDNSYRTMDANYTESIWWAFKELYDKGLVYEGRKIMYICPRCETPLAQSEVALNYQDVADLAVTAKFELEDEPGTYLLAWTTTPWTLPANTAVAVNRNFTYVKVKILSGDKKYGGTYILARDRLEQLGDLKHEVLEEFHGGKLIGKKYKPVFNYHKESDFPHKENIWKVWHADFVTAETGTGIAHEAPAYGAEDMELAQENRIPVIEHVNMDGTFKKDIVDFAGFYVKKKDDTQSTDVEIIKNLSHRGLLFAKEKIIHSYPLCWRCDTPLLNYATSSWFVKVTAIKSEIIDENQKIHWVPEHIRDGRFGRWLEGARDWAISRSRYWGAPIPVWKCAGCKKVHVAGDVKAVRVGKPRNKYIVMRHGESKSNVEKYVDFSGDPSNHLTKKGEEEVKETARGVLPEKNITKIICSPLIRARETAEIVARELGLKDKDITYDSRLGEFNRGEVMQGKGIEQREHASSARDFYITHHNGESHAHVKKRVTEALLCAEREMEGENVLFITHGSPMWMLISAAGLFTDEETIRYKEKMENETDEYFIKNAEVVELDFAPFPNDGKELNLHRPFIDGVVFPCSCGGKMHRVPEVFDCWFESGAMPFAQFHYPFENKDLFRSQYPADFIAEALDQTRGWFYSLIVLGVGLFGKTPYRNVICTGLLMAEDGQKMSKRLKNYTDPIDLINQYGADAFRMALLSSAVVRGEEVAFGTKIVDEVYKKVIVRLENVLSFYSLFKVDEVGGEESTNILDRYILARLKETVAQVTEGFERYELDMATRPIFSFVDDLSVWYVRRSRERFKNDNKKERFHATSTLLYVLASLSKIMTPSAPFIAERIYHTIGGKEESVNLDSWPKAHAKLSSGEREVVELMGKTRDLVSLALLKRSEARIRVRQPLSRLCVKDESLRGKEEYIALIRDEVNVKEVSFDSDFKEEIFLSTDITEELRKEGELRELIRAVQELRKIKRLTHKDKATLSVFGDSGLVSFVRENREKIKRACVLEDIKYVGEKIGERATLFEKDIYISISL